MSINLLQTICDNHLISGKFRYTVKLTNNYKIECYEDKDNQIITFLVNLNSIESQKIELNNVTTLSEEEFFQYSLDDSFQFCNINLLKSIQIKAKQYFKNKIYMFYTINDEMIEYEY